MEYEVVRYIKNHCPNNQMRDIFFEEVACQDPVEYLRERLTGKKLEMTLETGAEGTLTIHALVDGNTEKFVFTPI